MAALETTLRDPGYENWVKGCLSLKAAKKGIENFVERNTDKFHKDTLNSLATGANCGNCTNEDIVKKNKKCPNTVCDQIKNTIVNEHRFRGPTWRNTDVQHWVKEPWALAKCFISPGYASTATASDTDFTGLLAVIINHKMFDNLVTDILSSRNNIFCQSRDVRNTILHNANMKLTDTELKDFIAILDSMLSDSKYLAVHPDAIDAKLLLDKILNGQINISAEDEREARALRELDQKKQEALAIIDSAETKATYIIKEEKEKGITALQKELSDGKENLKVEKDEAISAVQKEMLDDKKAIEVEKDKTISTMQKELSDGKRDIIIEKEKAITEVQKEVSDGKIYIKVEKESIKDEKEHAIKAMRKEVSDGKQSIKEENESFKVEKKQAIRAMQKELSDCKQSIKEENESFKVEKEQVIRAMRKEVSDGKESIKQEKEEAVTLVQKELKVLQTKKEETDAAYQAGSKDNYEQLKKDMVAELISVYHDDDEMRAPLSPLVKTEHIDIEEMYVKPNMEIDNKPIDSYKDIFKDGRKKIYVVGNAGLGKTSLCQKMVSTWCQVHLKTNNNLSNDQQRMIRSEINVSNEINANSKKRGSTSFCQKIASVICGGRSASSDNLSDAEHIIDVDKLSDTEYIVDINNLSDELQAMASTETNMSGGDNYLDDQQAMAQFDFLFYISLRDAITENDVEDMIKHQLLADKFHEDLPTVLKNERCLVILDGLDEWTRDNTTARRQNKGIPGKQSIRNCTVLTTTRPWKLEAIQLTSTQIDAKVELHGIPEDSSKKLIQMMLHHLNKKDKTHEGTEKFVSELKERGIDHFMTIPVILKQLICLWCSGKQLGHTKCAIYSQMMELLLELAQHRLNEDSKYRNSKDRMTKSSIQLPSCFDGNDNCEEFKPLLVALAKLAFKTLLNENQESSLVFKQSQAEIHGMTAADLYICLNIGILSQSGIVRNCTSHKQLSFLHKSYQEFLAALHVSTGETETEQCIKVIQQMCQSADECLEMHSMVAFVSGMSSETTCTLINHIMPYLESGEDKMINCQEYLTDCLSEGWRCSHNNKHLQCRWITFKSGCKVESMNLLCQANISNMEVLRIATLTPTVSCLDSLQQGTKLEKLVIHSSLDTQHYRVGVSEISEDNIYSLISHHSNTLNYISIRHMTFTSKTKLSKLLQNVPKLKHFYLYFCDLSQQQIHSLENLKKKTPDIIVITPHCKVLPEERCTE